MNILFFIGPEVEWGQPLRKLWWVCNAIAIMHRLEPDRRAWKDRFRILTGTVLARHARLPLTGPYAGPVRAIEDPFHMPDGVLRELSRADLRVPFDADVAATAAAWYHDEATDRQRAAMAALIRDRVGNFTPDVVMTFTVAPFLADAYPDALVIDHESGMFTNAPFPTSFILDPCGKYRFSFLRRFSDGLLQGPLDDPDRARLARLRRRYLDDILIPKSPFAGFKQTLREGFDSVWLVPTHLPANPLAARLRYRDFIDYLCWLLDEVGPRNGIIVAQHPFFETVLTPETDAYLREAFENYIPVENEWTVSCSTHFLLDIADGIIALDSSTAQHGLLWQKKIVTVVDNHFSGFAHANSLDDLAEVARQPWTDGHEALFHWMLTHYYVPRPYYEDPAFLEGFLARSLERWRNGSVDARFFDPIDAPDRVFDAWIDGADPEVPQSRLRNMGWVGTSRVAPMYHALEHECAHLKNRIDYFENRVMPELIRLRTESMRQHLLQPGSPLRLSPFAGTGPEAPVPPALVATDRDAQALWSTLAGDPWNPEPAVHYAGRLHALGETETAARVLVWASLGKPPAAVGALIRSLLQGDGKLSAAWLETLGMVSAGRRRRTEIYSPDGGADLDRIVDALRRDGAAVWPRYCTDRDRLSAADPAHSGPTAPGTMALFDRRDLLEVVARAFGSDVRRGPVEAGGFVEGAAAWCASPRDRILVAVRLSAPPDPGSPFAEVAVPVALPGQDARHALQHWMANGTDNAALLTRRTRYTRPLRTPAAGDAVLIRGDVAHRWLAPAETVIATLLPDTLRNRALQAIQPA